MKLDNCSHFYCNSCNKIKSITKANKVRVAWPVFDRGNEDRLIFNKGTLLICNKCFEDKEDKK